MCIYIYSCALWKSGQYNFKCIDSYIDNGGHSAAQEEEINCKKYNCMYIFTGFDAGISFNITELADNAICILVYNIWNVQELNDRMMLIPVCLFVIQGINTLGKERIDEGVSYKNVEKPTFLYDIFIQFNSLQPFICYCYLLQLQIESAS